MLLLVVFLVWPIQTMAAQYRSAFGFPFTLSGNWEVLTPKAVAARYKGKSLKSLGLHFGDNMPANAILQHIKHGDVEYYFDKTYSSQSVTNNISVQLIPAGATPTESAVRAECKTLPRRLRAVYGQGTRVESCRFFKNNGVAYFGYEYQPANSQAKGVTIIQRQIPYLSNTEVQLVGASNEAGLSHMRKAVQEIALSVTRYASRPNHSGASGTARVLSRDEQRVLAESTMHAFGLAVDTKDFTAFHERLAPEARQRISVDKLKETFKGFMDRHINLLALDGAAPKFTRAPAINKNGVLLLKGFYPAGLFRVFFEFGYEYDRASWKLVALNVHIGEAAHRIIGKMPSGKQRAALVEATMHEFGLAVNAENFAKFYNEISQAWRLQVTPERLAQAFKPFGVRHVNLLQLDGVTPRFTKAPFISKQGELFVQGFFRTTPSRVNFKLGYIYEHSTWKLLKIAVNIRPAKGSNGTAHRK